jgi:hypothetical protein
METNEIKDNETKGQEPLSGETGNVEAGEPYDKGNDESATGNATEGKEDTTTSTDAPGNTPATTAPDPHTSTSKTGVPSTSTNTHDPSTATSSDKPSSSNDNSGPGAAPSVGANPASAPQDTQKQQGADRPSDEPSTGGENQAIKETKKEAEEANNMDTSGPGPKTLEEKARESGGVVGAKEGEEGDKPAGEEEGGDDDGPQKESKGEGTGEQYVKSSGMKADGGDFDASNPGAGREADRLLEEKGVHHTAPGEPKEDISAGQGTPDPKDKGNGGKVKLSQKIKDKLHISKDKD